VIRAVSFFQKRAFRVSGMLEQGDSQVTKKGTSGLDHGYFLLFEAVSVRGL